MFENQTYLGGRLLNLKIKKVKVHISLFEDLVVLLVAPMLYIFYSV